MNVINAFKIICFTKFKGTFAYRSGLIISFIAGPIYYFIQYCIWSAVFSSRSEIGGLTLSQVLTYYAIIAVISYLISDSVSNELSYVVYSGSLLSNLLKPVSYIIHSLAEKAGERLSSFILEFIPIFLVFVFVFKVNLIPANIFLLVISIILSFMIMFFTNFLIGCSAFWLTTTLGIRLTAEVIHKICSGILIPLSLFPLAVQKFLLFLPFPYIVYAPVSVYIGSFDLGDLHLEISQVILLQLTILIAAMLLTVIVWSKGIRKFSGVGS